MSRIKLSYYFTGWVILVSLGLTALRAFATLPAPGGLTASASNGSVTIEWTPVASSTAYFIYRSLLADTPGPLTPTLTPTDTPSGTPTPPSPQATVLEGSPLVFSDFQVTNGRRYLYQVAAIDPTGLGLFSSITAIPFSAPSAVQPVTVSNIHSNALDLSWGIPLSSFPVSYYQVYRYAVLTDTPVLFPTLTPTPTLTGSTTPFPTPTMTPSPVLPPIPAATLLASATPIATVFGNTFSDASAGSLLTDGIYYLVMAVDNQATPALGSAPSLSTKAALARNLAPATPVLSGMILATATPAYGIRLLWNGPGNSEGVTAYQLYANGVSLTTIAAATPSPTYSYDDSSIPFSGSSPVTYKVAALNSFGINNSNTVIKSLSKSSVPNPIVVTPDNTQGVTLSWQEGTGGTFGLAGYRIYKSQQGVPVSLAPGPYGTPTPTGSATPTRTPSPFATVVITPSSTPTLIIVDSGNTNAHHWSYWVEPFDELNLGGNIGTAPSPGFLNLAPTPAFNVTASAGVSANSVTVSWNNGGAGFYGPIQNYLVFRSVFLIPTSTPLTSFTPTASPTPLLTSTSTPSPTAIATTGGAQNNVVDFVSGSPGTTVVYKIIAVDLKGNESNFSAPSNSVTLGSLGLPAPAQVNPFTGSDSAIRFSWLLNSPADQIDSYQVFGSDWPNMTVTPTPLAVIIPAATMTYAPTPSTWNASTYYLLTHNSNGFSQPATLSGIPVPTYQVTAVMTPGVRVVEVSWNMAPVLATSTPEINSFGIYRSLSPGINFTPIASVTITSFAFTDNSVLEGQHYYYRVTARANGGGLSSESPLYPTLGPTPEAEVFTWPSRPAGVTAVSGLTQTTLSWTGNSAPESVLGYAVLQNGTPTMTIVPSPTFSISIPETPGNISSYQVVAQNAKGDSDPSFASSVLAPPAMTPTVDVVPPLGFIPTPGVTPSQRVWISGLTYTGSVNAYSVLRSVDPAFNPVSVSFAGSSFNPVSFLSDLSPVPGYVNYYKVVADNGAGVSVNPGLVPAVPVSLWPALPLMNLTGSSTAVTVHWDPPAGNVPVSVYNFYRNVYPTLTPVFLNQTNPPALSLPDLAVTPGTGYLYWMEALNSSGSSGLSAPQTLIPLQPPVLSITPMPGRNALVWSPVTVLSSSPVTGYVVYRAIPIANTTPTFVNVSGIIRNLAVTAFTDSSNVVDSATYIYKVAATTLNNQLSDFSNQVAVTVAPMPVTGLTAVSGDGTAQLRWNYQGTPNNQYLVQRKLGSAPDSDYQTLQTGVIGLSFLDTGLLDKTFYTYRIVTVDPQGLTANSFPAIALPARPPLLPASSAVTLAQNSDSAQTLIGNTLSWGGANQSGFDPQTMYPLGGYVVYRSTDGGGVYDLGPNQPAVVPVTWVNGVPESPVTYFDQVQLVGGPTYTYLVQAFDMPPDLSPPLKDNLTQGLVHTSNYDLVTAYPVGSNTALDRNAIRPFGAPQEQKVNIRFVMTEQGQVNIRVYSLNGTFVRELVKGDFAPGIHWTLWDATNMNGSLVASGVYLISTESPGGHQEFQKVAVIK